MCCGFCTPGREGQSAKVATAPYAAFISKDGDDGADDVCGGDDGA